jgi:hypothetical protein
MFFIHYFLYPQRIYAYFPAILYVRMLLKPLNYAVCILFALAMAWKYYCTALAWLVM